MKNKKSLLIGIGILFLCCIAAVCVIFLRPSSAQVNVNVDPVSDEFDEEYTNIQRVDCDPYMKMDGVLDEPEWAGKQPFTNRFSDDISMVKANLQLITHLTQKGIYVGATVFDTNIVCDGLNAPRKNSTLQLNIAGPEASNKIGIHNVYMNAQNIVTTSNANVASCAYGVKVDGQINSGSTQKITMELFLPWSAIGMAAPENPDEALVLLNPLYNAIEAGQTISKQLRMIPYSTTAADTFLRFSQAGFVDIDEAGALLGNSAIGVAKAGVWDISGLSVNTAETDEYTTSLAGRAKTGWGRYHLAYLPKAYATNFILEATVVPYSYNSAITYNGYAGFAAMLPGEKQVSLRMTLDSSTIGTNASNEQNQKRILITRVYQDFQNGVYDALQVVDKTNQNYAKQEGVRLKFIKNGSQYFMYADDILIWAGNESRGGSAAFPALFSYNCQVEYKDIRFVNYDDRTEELKNALLDSNTCLISTEVEGAGALDVDTIAVSKGGSATVTISAMPQYVLTDIQVNGKSVMGDFTRNAFFEGVQSKYTVKNITEHTVIKAVYEMYEGTQLSGKVSLPENDLGLDASGTAIYAFMSDGRLLSFTSAVAADGSYSISLPQGTYSKLYFVHSHYEQVFYRFSDGSALKIGAQELTDRNFTLTYPTFESLVIGPTLQTGQWNFVDNGKYFAAGNTAANNYNTAYFRNSDSDNFLIRTTVKAEPGALVGVMLNGTYIDNAGYQMLIGFTAGGNKAITLFGWHATARPVNWIGTTYGSDPKAYPSNNTYEIVVARKDDSIVMYVNGVQMAFWSGKIKDFDGAAFDMSQFYVNKAGLSLRAYQAATFYNYSYSTDEQEINDLMCSTVTFDALPEGVSIQINGKDIGSGEKVPTGKDIQVKFPVDNGKAYCVTVNGKAITHDCVNGTATFKLEKDSVIKATESPAYKVSGTVAGDFSGSVMATNKKTGAKYSFPNGLQKGEYQISLPNGSYKIYFDCGTREGMRNSTVVNGADVADQDLKTTYQKLYVEFMGGNPSVNNSGMTANGVYYLTPAKNGNSNTIGYFNSAKEPVNNFVIKTHVYTQGGETGIMMYGYDGDKTNPDVLVHLSKSGMLSFYGWGISWKDRVQLDTTTYDPTSFDLTVVKNGSKIFVFIDGNLVHSWNNSGEVKISQLTDLRVGLLVRGEIGATYSGYSMSTGSSAIFSALGRKLSFDLPEGFTVTAGGKTLKSGGKVAIGTDVTIHLPKDSPYMYAITVNGEPLEVSYTKNSASFEMSGESVIQVQAQAAYSVSGTIPAGMTGSVIATEQMRGQAYSYENVAADGVYAIRLPDGKYDLYFDFGKVEGMINDVAVSGADAIANLDKSYPKLTPYKMGDAGTAQWVLTGNGRYHVQTSNTNVNAVAMGYFADGVNLGNTDFVIHTNVEAPGTDAVLLGLTLSNGKESVVYGLNNSNQSAQIRVLMANGWLSYQALNAYDRTNFRLTVVKTGDVITYFINGVQAARWTKEDYDITGWKNAMVGLGIYRMYDVTFSDFSYSTEASDIAAVINRTVTYGTLPEGVTVSVPSGSSLPMGTQVSVNNLVGENIVYTVTVNGQPLTVAEGSTSFVLTEDCQIEVSAAVAYQVSGTVIGNGNGKVIATNAEGAQQVFADALVNGAYSIRLGDGTYRLYFDCGDREGVITGVTVNGAAVTVPELTKTYQKLTVEKAGSEGTANWVMTENGRYEVNTSNTSTNSVSYGWFAKGVNLSNTDFVIKTQVEAAGNKAVMMGLVISSGNETVVYGLNNSNYSAQIRVLQANGWPGYRNVPSYDRTNFELTIVKKGTTVTYYINGVQACQWTASEFNFSGWTDTKVGIGFYRMFDVSFSDYSYSTDASDIEAVNNRTVTYSTLPEGVTVSVASGSSLPMGTEITVSNLNASGVTYTVLVNGSPVTVAEGKAIFTLTENCEIVVTATYGNTVSGTVAEKLNGSVTAIDSNGGKQVFTDALVDGSYSVQLGDGTYSLYFDCGDREGMITGVTVSGGPVVADLAKTYQKLTAFKAGDAGTANWVLTENGRYEVQTSNENVNSVSMGYFADGVNLATTDFIIRTSVEAAGNKAVMMGLVISSGSETVVYGLNNSNQTAQIRVLMANGWPGYRNVPSYDRTNFELIIVKKGTTVTYYINGVQACQWTASDFNFSGWTSAKVGIGFYRMHDVTFSDYSYTTGNMVTGTVGEGLNGSVTATNAEGESQVFENALANGSYAIALPDGTYSLYFDCVDTEGLLSNVAVSDGLVRANLTKTYQKLTALKAGDAGTANWVLTENGRYEVQTSNESVNSVSMGYFTDGINLANTDFVIQTDVKAAGNKAAMIGLTLHDGQETVVYGLNNSNNSAQIRVLMANDWPGYRSVAAYDRTNFQLTIVKKGDSITYSINGAQVCQWTKNDYDFTKLSEAKVGLGIYRMYDVTFSNYSLTITTDTTAYQVSGTVGGNASGHITVTDAGGSKTEYKNALTNGSYSLMLQNGIYSLYFDCGDREGMITGVTVNGEAVTVPTLTKTYQKLTALKAGDAGTANWVLTENGRYEVQTSNENVNSVSMGYFADGVNLATTDFIIRTNVEAAGNKAVMMGLVVHNGTETVVYGLNNSNQSAQIRVLMANGWPGYKNVATYDRTNFELTIVKKGTTVTYYINGVQACQWTASDFNFSGWTSAKVGIGFYRMYDVTFSEYSYSTDADDIAAALQ